MFEGISFLMRHRVEHPMVISGLWLRARGKKKKVQMADRENSNPLGLEAQTLEF